ncbi:MAG: DNA methyltransferase, partial [Promethearchaeota archaeon]
MNDIINKITLANCIDVLPQIEGKSIDFIFTDPPYITALADLYKSWNSRNMDWLFYAEQFDRILKDNGQIATFSDFPTAVAISNAFQKYFRFRFYWTWIKSNGQPVNSKQPRSNVELISVWAKKKGLTRDLTYNPIMKRGLCYIKRHRAGNKTRKQEKDYITESNGDRFPSQTLYYPSKD